MNEGLLQHQTPHHNRHTGPNQDQDAELSRQHMEVGWRARPEGQHESKRTDDERRSEAVEQGAAQRHARRSRINAKHKQDEERAAGLGAQKIEQSSDREIEECQPGEGEARGQSAAEQIIEQIVSGKREHEHPDREGNQTASRHQQRDQQKHGDGGPA